MKTRAKLLVPVLASCFLALGLVTQSVWAVMIADEPSGFRGNRWGDSPLNGPPLRFVNGPGKTNSMKQVDRYDRSTVGITLNGVSLFPHPVPLPR